MRQRAGRIKHRVREKETKTVGRGVGGKKQGREILAVSVCVLVCCKETKTESETRGGRARVE